MHRKREPQIFLSWSGQASFACATLLRGWLPTVLPVKPWLSGKDITAGSRWQPELERNLKEAVAGVLCITPDIVGSEWVLFEAGALAHRIPNRGHRSVVCPYLLRTPANAMPEPLRQFQSAEATEDGTLSLATALNELLPQPLPKEAIERNFENAWPKLREDLLKLEGSSKSGSKPKAGRTGGGRVSHRGLREETRRITEHFLSLCSGEEPRPVALRNLPALLSNGSSQATPEFVHGVARGIADLLQVLGAVDMTVDEEIRPESPFAAAFLGSLRAHIVDGVPFFDGWDAHGNSSEAIAAREVLKALETRRVRDHGATTSRTAHVVLILIKAHDSDGKPLLLMQHNPRWHSGMWWFIGGITSESVVRNPERAVRDIVRKELALADPKSYTLGTTPFRRQISDRRISDRLGAFTEYRFTLVPVILNDTDDVKQLYASMEPGCVRGSDDRWRCFRWLSWDDIRVDHPVAPDTPELFTTIEKELPYLPASKLTLPSVQFNSPDPSGKKYRAVILDAGGVLFIEDYWRTKLQRRYHRLNMALPPTEIPPTELQFARLSSLLSTVGNLTPGLDTEALLRRVYDAFGAPYESPSGMSRGNLSQGVIDTLVRLRSAGIRCHVLSNASMSGEEFMGMYGAKLSDSDGPLIESAITCRDIGASKICPYTYEKTLATLGYTREEVLMVGHELDDIIGASMAGGIDVVAVNLNRGEIRIAEKFAIRCFKHFEEVADFLQSNRRSMRAS